MEQYEPIGHVEAAVTPAAQYWPLAHATCAVVLGQNEPAAQDALVRDPAGQ